MKVDQDKKIVALGEKDVALVGREGGEIELFVPGSDALPIAPIYLEFIVGCGLLSADPKFVQVVCKTVKETMTKHAATKHTPSNIVMN